ncbi:MAG: SDR family NAD(P)-dependent oxidoreductase [Spirochaetes bacterium]|nr:SDR family NAD(P)-dependent oxidoreductase [Spirochaetota bacterium]
MQLKGAKIAVTGATGMLGVYISRALRKKGAQVIGVVRNPDKAGFLRGEGVEFRQADLMNAAALEQAFAGADALVSNAALYQLTNLDWDQNYAANKTGTENVYNAAAKAGIKRAIQISTVGLYRFGLFQDIDETSSQVNGEAREGGAYRATKQISEALAWRLCAQHGIRLTALRPSGVYGARDTNLMPYFKIAMKLPLLPMPGVSWPLVYAGDVADAVVAALENERSVGEAYNTTGDTRDFADFLTAWRTATGKGAWVMKLPLGLGVKFPSAKAERALGFTNRPFVEALREIFTEDPSLAQ